MMIVREIKETPDEVLKTFDYFNDYKDTRAWAEHAAPEIIDRLDRGQRIWRDSWRKKSGW